MSSIKEQNTTYRTLTFGEEMFNSISHGIGVVLSVGATKILLSCATLKGDIWHLISFSVFGFSLFLLYLSSTLYHSFNSSKIKNLFARFDHAAIFLLIAGTYTPFILTVLRNPLGWTLFIIIWGLAVTGAVIRTIYPLRYRKLMVWNYLFMGWMFLVAIVPISKILPESSIFFLFAGGMSYSLGVIFYLRRKMKYSHGIWHLFVLGGSISHFFSVLYSIG
jgi:hemolysin III